MCGILIAVNPPRPVSHDTLGPLRRRGPDGLGFWTDGRVTVAHTRLAIVGLSQAGTEPLHNDRFVMAWNGEAYNYDRRHHTDAHWLLNEPGSYAHGFGALAVYDRLAHRVTLERDALGVKPLYYWHDGKDTFAASSMLEPLLDLGSPRDLDFEAIAFYARYQLPLGDRTFFKSIKRVMPGHRVTFDGAHVTSKLVDDIWRQLDEKEPDEDWILDTRCTLVECVTEAAMGDVPFTTTCSGGLDSSAVTAILRPEHAYHANFSDPDCNETQYARLVHPSLMVTNATDHRGQGLVDALRSIVEDFDELGVGSVILPLDDLFRSVSKRYKVVLTGTGGDELFAGYARYKLERGEAVPGYKYSAAASVTKDWHEKGEPSWYNFTCHKRPESNSLDFDRQVFLPALLNIDDKIAGRHGIEARPAMLHQKFVRRMMTLDPKWLTRGELKEIGRQVMRGMLPDAVIDRKDKMGFSTPIGTMISSAASAIRDQLHSSRWKHLYRLDRVQYAASDKWDRRLFGLLMLDLWLHRYA